MQKQKLLKLAKGLRNLTRSQQRHFDMDTFLHCGENDEYPTKMPSKFKSCDTASCALGWATAFFPRSKLKFDEGFSGTIRFDDKYDFEAGAAMFGLTVDESYYLFDPWKYRNINGTITPKIVAKRIEEMVKHGGIPNKDEEDV